MRQEVLEWRPLLFKIFSIPLFSCPDCSIYFMFMPELAPLKILNFTEYIPRVNPFQYQLFSPVFYNLENIESV